MRIFLSFVLLLTTTLAATAQTIEPQPRERLSQEERQERRRQAKARAADRYDLTPAQREEMAALRAKRPEGRLTEEQRKAYRKQRGAVLTEEQRAAVKSDRKQRRSRRPEGRRGSSND